MLSAVTHPDFKLSGPKPAVDDVFIVEDEPVARRALQYLMTSRGYRVSAFATAEEAMAAARRFGVPPVLVVDLNLPGMNGIEFITLIEKASTGVFPVLVTGAATEELDRLRGKHAVMVMTKPLDFARLIRLIEKKNSAN